MLPYKNPQGTFSHEVKAEFEENQMAQSAVIREFQVMGEAAKLVSINAQTQYAQIAWHKIAGMRNRMVYEYFRIDLDIVWDTVQQEVPGLITQMEAIVPPENP